MQASGGVKFGEYRQLRPGVEEVIYHRDLLTVAVGTTITDRPYRDN